jgi:hypothetical protein
MAQGNDTAYLPTVAVARVWAVLPAAGAYDAAPLVIPCAGFDWAMFYISYERGAAGGAVSMRIDVSPRSIDVALRNWFRASLYAAAVLAAGADAASGVQREGLTYGSTAAGTESFAYGPVQLAGVVERLRVACAESGVVGSPGNAEIVCVFGTGR